MAGLPLIALTVCLFISAGESHGFFIQKEHSQITVTVGGDAFFNVQPSAETWTGGWYIGGSEIAYWFGPHVSIANEYTSRAVLFTDSGSLLLKSVMVSDSGEYQVGMISTSGFEASATIFLQVVGESHAFTIHTEHSRITVTVGGDAFFDVKPSAAIKAGSWFFEREVITVWRGRAVSVYNEYISRVDVFTTNGSLLLKSVKPSDSGMYHMGLTSNSNLNATLAIALQVPGESQRFSIHTEHSRITATVGNDVFFKVGPSAAIKDGFWLFRERKIVNWVGTAVDSDHAYISRVKLFTNSGSLLLKSVKVSDSGEYLVVMSPTSGSQANLAIALQVLDESQGFTIHTKQSLITATVGGDAFFNVEPSAAIKAGTWQFGEKTITKWTRPTVKFYHSYSSRAELFSTNGSLLLKSVKVSDSGKYRVDVTTNSGSHANLTIALKVLDSSCSFSPSAIVCIGAGLLAVALISGIGGWLIGRKTGGAKVPPQPKYDGSITSRGKNTLATDGDDAMQTYEDMTRNVHNESANSSDVNCPYMGLKMEDRSVYSDLKR